MGFIDSLKQGPSAKTWKAPTEADRQFEIAVKRIEEQQEWNEDRAKERQRRFSELRELEARNRRAELRNEHAHPIMQSPNMHRLSPLDLAPYQRRPLPMGGRPMPNPMFLRHQPSPHHEMERIRQMQRRREFMQRQQLQQQRARAAMQAERAREAERALEAQRAHEAQQQLRNARVMLENRERSYAREADLANRERLASIQRQRMSPRSPPIPFSPYEETTSTFVQPFPSERPRRLSEPPLPQYPMTPRTPAPVPWSPSMGGQRLSPRQSMYPPTSGSAYTLGPPPRMRRRSSHELEIPSMAAMTPLSFNNEQAREMAMREQTAMQRGTYGEPRQQDLPFAERARNRQSAIF